MSGRTGHPERPTTIGLIGLGLIGSAVAERLLAAGHTVIGFDVDEKARLKLSQQGGVRTATAAEVAEEADLVWLALPNDTVSREVLSQIDGSLRSGHIIADLGTGDPRTAETVAETLRHRGVTFLDATISGSSAKSGAAMCWSWLVATSPRSVFAGGCLRPLPGKSVTSDRAVAEPG